MKYIVRPTSGKSAQGPPASSRGRRQRRGTAEIETMLVLPVLFGILWLVKGSCDFGVGRLTNIFHAEEVAYSDATTPVANPAGTDGGYLDPSTGFTDVMPQLPETLPNRMHVGEADTTVNYAGNLPLPANKLTDREAFAGPAWAYSAWPQGNANGFSDATTTDDWYSDYAAQVRTDTISSALELSPSAPP